MLWHEFFVNVWLLNRQDWLVLFNERLVTLASNDFVRLIRHKATSYKKKKFYYIQRYVDFLSNSTDFDIFNWYWYILSPNVFIECHESFPVHDSGIYDINYMVFVNLYIIQCKLLPLLLISRNQSWQWRKIILCCIDNGFVLKNRIG